MLSTKGQLFKNWLFQNVKNAPAATTVAEARERLAKLSGATLPEGINITPIQENGVNGEWVNNGPVLSDQAVLYFHGGGFIMGSAKTGRGLAFILSQATHCPVFTVDYRLAPEHPFPAALDDAVAAYRWLLHRGTRPGNIALVGDSAGGGLCLAALTVLQKAKDELPAAACLITPWLDLLGTGQSRQTKQASDPWYNPDSIELQAGQLYAGDHDLKDPLISPLYTDIEGFPPLLIHAAGDDTLVDDSIRFYEKWQKTRADVTFAIWEDMWHVWHHFAAQVPEAREAVDQLGGFVREKMGSA